MKFKSVRQYYEDNSCSYIDAIPWGDLSEETRRYWTKHWNLCREREEKEVLDDSCD